MTAKKGDTFKNFRNALQGEQSESEWNQKTYRPAQQAAGIWGHLAVLPGVDKTRPRELREQQAEWQQKKHTAKQINPGLGAFRQTAVDDVDTHVAVVLVSVTGGQ